MKKVYMAPFILGLGLLVLSSCTTLNGVASTDTNSASCVEFEAAGLLSFFNGAGSAKKVRLPEGHEATTEELLSALQTCFSNVEDRVLLQALQAMQSNQ